MFLHKHVSDIHYIIEVALYTVDNGWINLLDRLVYWAYLSPVDLHGRGDDLVTPADGQEVEEGKGWGGGGGETEGHVAVGLQTPGGGEWAL